MWWIVLLLILGASANHLTLNMCNQGYQPLELIKCDNIGNISGMKYHIESKSCNTFYVELINNMTFGKCYYIYTSLLEIDWNYQDNIEYYGITNSDDYGSAIVILETPIYLVW